jgi:hypothetical protein
VVVISTILTGSDAFYGSQGDHVQAGQGPFWYEAFCLAC